MTRIFFPISIALLISIGGVASFIGIWILSVAIVMNEIKIKNKKKMRNRNIKKIRRGCVNSEFKIHSA